MFIIQCIEYRQACYVANPRAKTQMYIFVPVNSYSYRSTCTSDDLAMGKLPLGLCRTASDSKGGVGTHAVSDNRKSW